MAPTRTCLGVLLLALLGGTATQPAPAPAPAAGVPAVCKDSATFLPDADL